MGRDLPRLARAADTYYGMGLDNPIHLILLLVEIGIPVLVVMGLIKYLSRSMARTATVKCVAAPAATEGVEAEASPVDVIAQLAMLYEAGALTEEEFTTKKAELLAACSASGTQRYRRQPPRSLSAICRSTGRASDRADWEVVSRHCESAALG